MSPMFSRTLTFMANDLGEEATLMLTIAGPADGSPRDKFPIVWRVLKFGSTGPYRASLRLTYQNQLAVLKPEIEDDTVTGVAAFKLIDVGQVTGLTKGEDGAYSFTNPYSVVKVWNDSTDAEDMALGFFGPNDSLIPDPILFFKGIPPLSIAETQFTPVLRAYITDQYHENQIIFDNISALWEGDLSKLPENTNWVLSRDQATGAFRITAA